MRVLANCLLVLSFLSIWAVTTFAQKVEHTTDSLETVQKNVREKKAVLIDTRTKEEWEQGHLKGAILLPLLELEEGLTPEQIAKRVPKDKILYTHCVRGARSLAVQEMLKPLGYDVRALKPGYKELLKHGFPKAEE